MMKRVSLVLVTLLLCISCSEDPSISNPFLGTWTCQESTIAENGVTIYTSFSLTFFEDMTYAVKVEYSSKYASESKVISGKYTFDDEKIWFDDGGKLFGNGGYCTYSMYKNVLKLVWSNDTLVFNRQ